MNDNGNLGCDYHPKHLLIGICALCLNEKLLILAANQSHSNSSKHSKFSFSSLLNLHRKSGQSVHKSDISSSPEPEESFISIKFEENGAALWEKGINATVSNFNPNLKETKLDDSMSVIEHAKPRGSLRWRKRIDNLFQVIKRKRSHRGNACHVGPKPEGVKVMRKGWLRILPRRRTEE